MNSLTDEFIPVTLVDNIEEGEMKPFEVEEEEILICRVGNSFYAVSGICTHECIGLDDGELEDFHLTCPLHFAQFDIRSGAPLSPPATEPLQVFDVLVHENQIYIKI
ncbi:non-heme iron oxygenase ferredoxin subunit [Bacillus sp. JJ1533]|uniref:non-heme iron oxygenase ferredoxin subunit n=1 Tax=Bacillus sp. JJ1533 TaxID=3122959 RepID=UPI002FFD6625